MSQSYDDRRTFAAQLLEASFFGAFIMAIDARKNEQGLTQGELAQRAGREKTGISKLLSGPRNWTIRTISDLAEALDLAVEFVLVDRLNSFRQFTPTGIEYNVPYQNVGSNLSVGNYFAMQDFQVFGSGGTLMQGQGIAYAGSLVVGGGFDQRPRIYMGTTPEIGIGTPSNKVMAA